MDNTLIVICTLILMIGSGIGGWYLHKWAITLPNDQQVIQALLIEREASDKYIKELEKWQEDSSKIHQQIINQYTPEVIGEHITEPEDIKAIEDDLTWQQWKKGQEYQHMQEWREEQQKQCTKDIDRRIPGHGC